MILEGIILKGVGGLYKVATKTGIYDCKIRGKFRKKNVIPMVGDRVRIILLNDGTGLIDEILPRKNALWRPPLANVDQVLIIMAVKQPQYNLLQLDKLIVAAQQQALEAVICINKIDLCTSLEEEASWGKIYEQIGYHVAYTSVVWQTGLDQLRQYLDNKISVLTGPSGVGKSSLINCLCDGVKVATGEISHKLGRGKHTTRHVELLPLGGNNGMIADTPGFSALTLKIDASELDKYFIEFSDYAAQCRFSDCLHVKEPYCAVKDAVDRGLIDRGRYERYINILEELREEKGFTK